MRADYNDLTGRPDLDTLTFAHRRKSPSHSPILVTGITTTARFERFLSTFQQVNNRLNYVGVVDGAMVYNFAATIALRIQHDDLLSVSAYENIRVVGANNYLPLFLELCEDPRQHVPN